MEIVVMLFFLGVIDKCGFCLPSVTMMLFSNSHWWAADTDSDCKIYYL